MADPTWQRIFSMGLTFGAGPFPPGPGPTSPWPWTHKPLALGRWPQAVTLACSDRGWRQEAEHTSLWSSTCLGRADRKLSLQLEDKDQWFGA